MQITNASTDFARGFFAPSQRMSLGRLESWKVKKEVVSILNAAWAAAAKARPSVMIPT